MNDFITRSNISYEVRRQELFTNQRSGLKFAQARYSLSKAPLRLYTRSGEFVKHVYIRDTGRAKGARFFFLKTRCRCVRCTSWRRDATVFHVPHKEKCLYPTKALPGKQRLFTREREKGGVNRDGKVSLVYHPSCRSLLLLLLLLLSTLLLIPLLFFLFVLFFVEFLSRCHLPHSVVHQLTASFCLYFRTEHTRHGY